MTAPVPAPGTVPVAPNAVPVPGQPVDPNAPPPDPAAEAGTGEVSPSSDQALAQHQMNIRFSMVKTTAQQQAESGGGQAAPANPAPPVAEPAAPPAPAPATQRTLPSTSG